MKKKAKTEKSKNLLHATKGHWWLITGVIAFWLSSFYGIASTIKGIGYLRALSVSIDWIAACVIYFFLGAIVGHIVDLLTSKKKNKVPEWLFLTLALWFVSSLALAIFADKALISPFVIVIFPLAYGIFFTSIAYTLLVPAALESSIWLKLVFNVAYLAIFFLWIGLPDKKTWLKRSALLLLFAILFLGFSGCAVTFAG